MLGSSILVGLLEENIIYFELRHRLPAHVAHLPSWDSIQIFRPWTWGDSSSQTRIFPSHAIVAFQIDDVRTFVFDKKMGQYT